jgi:ABC-type spermidine/putrescine transport system permease subunit I
MPTVAVSCRGEAMTDVEAGRGLGASGRLWLPFAFAPGLVIVACLCVYPLVLALAASVHGPDGLNLQRYVAFFQNARSQQALFGTMGLASATTIAAVLLSIPLGYIARASQRLGLLIRVLVALPLAVPVLIAGYALMLFYSTNGLLNNVLVKVLAVLSEPLTISYTWSGLIVACTWRFFPYTALLVISALGSLDRDLEKASYSIGAGPLQTLWRVTLPMITPAIVTGGVLTFVSTFGTFSIPLIMGGRGEVLSVIAYRKLAGTFDWGGASTVVVVMAVIQITTLVALRIAARRINRA